MTRARSSREPRKLTPRSRRGRKGHEGTQRGDRDRAQNQWRPTAPTPEGKRARFDRRSLLPLLIVVAGIIAYYGSFSGTFVLDDDKYILENERLYEIMPLSHTLSGRRPVVDLSLAVNYRCASRHGGTLDPWGFHVFNLVVHLLAGLALFGVVRRTLLLSDCRPRSGAAAPWLALVIAVIWVVHPLQTQSVTYIIQRAESMMGLFYLTALYCVIRGAGPRHAGPWYVAAVVAGALGMGSKAVMLTAPVVILLYDRVFLSKSFAEAMKRRGFMYAGLAATWSVLLVCEVAQGVLGSADATATVGFGYRGATPLTYAMTQPGVVLHYLYLSLWPQPLCLDYNWPLANTFWAVLGPSLAVLLLLGGTVWGLARRPWVGFLGLWFFLVLAPTSSIVPIKDPLFEHRMYLPLAAVVVLVVIGVHAVLGGLFPSSPSGTRVPRAVAAALGLGVVTLSIYGTANRNRVYESDLAMWRDVLKTRPDHPRAHLGLGAALFHKRQYEKAGEAFEKAISLTPDHPGAYHNLGHVREKRGDWPGAEEAYRTSLQINRRQAKVYYSLARLLEKLERPEEALEAYRAALQIDPKHASAQVDLGNMFRRQGRFEEALEHYRAGAAVLPRNANIRYNLGVTLKYLGRIDEAIVELETALRYDPDHIAKRTLDQLRGQQEGPPED